MKRLSFLFFLLLTGCSSTQSVYWQNILYALQDTPKVELTAGQVLQTPVDLVYVSNGERGQAAMALAYIENERLKWVSSDSVIFITQNERIIRTVGLDSNLLATTNLESDPLKNIQAETTQQEWLRTIDFDGQFNVQLKTTGFEINSANLSVLETHFETLEYIEHVKEIPSGMSWTNHFWVDKKSGELLKSIQKINSHADIIEMVYITRAARLIPQSSLSMESPSE